MMVWSNRLPPRGSGVDGGLLISWTDGRFRCIDRGKRPIAGLNPRLPSGPGNDEDARYEDFATSFRGCFHTVREDRIVQTFCWEEMPEAIALETLRVEDLGDGWSRLRCFSLGDSFEGRDAMLASGMETGVQDGYDKLDELLSDGSV